MGPVAPPARPRGRRRCGGGGSGRGRAVFGLGADRRGGTSRWRPCRSGARPSSRSRSRRSSPARRCACVELARIPEVLWVDDLSLIRRRRWSFRARRPTFRTRFARLPYGVARPYGTIGVLYLEGYRAALRLAGTTVLGVRLPSALAGALSLVTAALLGRALLPAGRRDAGRPDPRGAALAPDPLAVGLQHDRARADRRPRHAGAPGGAAAAQFAPRACGRRRRGIGAHVYLSAWPAGAALALFALWPAAAGERPRARAIRACAFVLGFAACAAPLFLFREGRWRRYFARTADHNVVIEMRREKSLLPPLAAAADAVASPWLSRRSVPATRPARPLAARVALRAFRWPWPSAARFCGPRDGALGAATRPCRRLPRRGRRGRPGGQPERVPLRLPHDAHGGRGRGRACCGSSAACPPGPAGRRDRRRRGDLGLAAWSPRAMRSCAGRSTPRRSAPSTARTRSSAAPRRGGTDWARSRSRPVSGTRRSPSRRCGVIGWIPGSRPRGRRRADAWPSGSFRPARSPTRASAWSKTSRMRGAARGPGCSRGGRRDSSGACRPSPPRRSPERPGPRRRPRA